MKGFGYFGLGDMCGDTKIEQKPKPQGLELKIIPERMELTYSGKSIGYIELSDGKYIYISNPQSVYDNGSILDSFVLRGIAAKLDELNGVDNEYQKAQMEGLLNANRGPHSF